MEKKKNKFDLPRGYRILGQMEVTREKYIKIIGFCGDNIVWGFIGDDAGLIALHFGTVGRKTTKRGTNYGKTEKE